MSRPVVTIGADPELFLGYIGGTLTSAIDRIGGHKSAPRSLQRAGFFVQEDNVAVEFNIPPATKLEEFRDSIQWAVTTIEDEVSISGLETRILASALFPEPELRDPRAGVFGCDPDFNAWRGGQINPRPKNAGGLLRSCGGHVHVGYPFDADIDKHRLIQLMDLYLGVPSVLMDEDTDRRKLYGRAGAMRPTDYGVEYRVLSNFWLKRPEYIDWVFTQTNRAVDKALEFGKDKLIKYNTDGQRNDYYTFIENYDLCDEIQVAIDTSNPSLAQKLIAHHDLALVV